MIDELMFLADRYEQTYQSVPAEVFRKWQKELNDLAPGTSDVLEMKRVNGNVRVVRRGRTLAGSGDTEPFTISNYYWFHEQHDAFRGRASSQGALAGDFTAPEVHERWAQQSQALWATGFRWDSLRRNILLNELASKTELLQLDVHYGFLSAFVHPTSKQATELLYGRDLPRRYGRYDHYVTELVLLYSIVLASRELRAFAEMSSRPPQFGLSEWDEVDRVLKNAEALSAYFWFPGGVPHDFDRIQEANNRGNVDGKFVPREERLPHTIPDDEIGYPRNPLRRLIKMHAHQNELTGFPYISPWPRSDAQWRT